MKKILAAYQSLIDHIKKFPKTPGVYLYKNDTGEVIYVGKAKDLRARGTSYIQSLGSDIKTDTIFGASSTVEYIQTETELEALLLEAQLIQSYQPRCNVLLKTGQPFLYIFISGTDDVPKLQLVRNQKKKGTYFGPFLEKGYARKVFDFLIKTFALGLCNKKIEGGCLFYHMGKCAGSCKKEFDKEGYLARLELAKKVLKQGHKKFIQDLNDQIAVHNKALNFERSRELHQYLQSFVRVFSTLETSGHTYEKMALKHVWVLSEDARHLMVFSERQGALKRLHLFILPFAETTNNQLQLLEEYISSFYQVTTPPGIILMNFNYPGDADVMKSFLEEWHALAYPVALMTPQQGHMHNIMRLAVVQAQQEIDKQASLPQALKIFLKLNTEPRSIDCFDISHKQGQFMVGACIRFTDGKPDKPLFRHFHIKTVEQNNDYASLREIVARRYKDLSQLPDLIVIDGGKGQLSAVEDLFPQAAFVALAKREETIFSKQFPEGKKLDQKSYVGQLLIALRDYTHHFAISFHKQIETIDR